jgi:hypothetical protein
MENGAVPVSPARAPAWIGLAAVPVAVALVLAGIWVAGGVITDDFRASMALTAVWFAAVAGCGVLLWRRVRVLRPAALAAVATFVVVGAYLGYTSTVDKTVDEAVVGGPAALEGSFRGLAHETSGTARIVGSGSARTLTLTGFRTDPGPDLFVYVVPGKASGTHVDGGRELAALKGNVGNQQYAIPGDVDLSAGGTVVVWCRAFSVAFGAADLAPTGS